MKFHSAVGHQYRYAVKSLTFFRRSQRALLPGAPVHSQGQGRAQIGFHQGIGGQLIRPAFGEDITLSGEAGHGVGEEVSHCDGSDIKCRSRLGGLLNFYYREAA